jgi:aspartyl-tRNA(Asn)/glutamyl-tRNA(Gln) amidotransferase subunit A
MISVSGKIFQDSLARRSAAELAQLLSRGEISATEVLADVLQAHEHFNPTLNAIVELNADAALAAAQASERRYAARSPLGPLDGIPVTVKDNIFVKGFGATWGSRLFATFRPEQDDIAIERLRASGAVLFAKTNTPEFALAAYTDNALYGPTRNPWNLAFTPGGSSGGAVAALAGGIGPLAVGTDAGGSIRRPASYTGVVGFRPSTGRIPRVFGFPALAADLQVIAPAARTVCDTYALFRAMAGSDIRDRSSCAFNGHPLPDELVQAPATRLRICCVKDVEGSPVDAEIREQFDATAGRLAALGHHVEVGRLPFRLDEIEKVWSTLTAVGLAGVVAGAKDASRDVQPAGLAAAQRGGAVPAREYSAVLETVQKIRRDCDTFFAEFDILLTPASAALPWAVGEDYPERIDGKRAGPRSAAVFATFVNIAGIPAISVPAGMGASRLPIGMQFASGFGEDVRLLELARELESAAPWLMCASECT